MDREQSNLNSTQQGSGGNKIPNTPSPENLAAQNANRQEVFLGGNAENKNADGNADVASQGAGAVRFHSKEIGTRTVKKEDPFKEQNQKHAEKKQQQEKQRRILIIAAVSVVALVVLGGVIWAVVAKIVGGNQPSADGPNVLISDGSDEEIANLRELANRAENGEELGIEFGDDDGGLETVETGDDVFVIAMEQAATKELQSQVRLAEIYYQFDQNNYDEIAEICSKINPEALTISQQQSLYNVCSDAYYQQGMDDLGLEYHRKTVEAAKAQQEEVEN